MTTCEGPPLATVAGIGALTLGGILDEVADRFDPHESLLDLDIERLAASPISLTTGEA